MVRSQFSSVQSMVEPSLPSMPALLKAQSIRPNARIAAPINFSTSLARLLAKPDFRRLLDPSAQRRARRGEDNGPHRRGTHHVQEAAGSRARMLSEKLELGGAGGLIEEADLDSTLQRRFDDPHEDVVARAKVSVPGDAHRLGERSPSIGRIESDG